MVSSVRHFWWNIQVCGHRHTRLNRIESLASMSQFNYWKFAFLSNSIFFVFLLSPFAVNQGNWTRGRTWRQSRYDNSFFFPFSFAIQTILNFIGNFWRNCISFRYNLRARVHHQIVCLCVSVSGFRVILRFEIPFVHLWSKCVENRVRVRGIHLENWIRQFENIWKSEVERRRRSINNGLGLI